MQVKIFRADTEVVTAWVNHCAKDNCVEGDQDLFVLTFGMKDNTKVEFFYDNIRELRRTLLAMEIECAFIMKNILERDKEVEE